MYYVLLILTLQGGYVGEVHGYNSMEACQSRLEIMKEVGFNATCELGGEM